MILLIVFLLYLTHCDGLDIFPWDKKISLNDRSDEILEMLRSKMGLIVAEDSYISNYNNINANETTDHDKPIFAKNMMSKLFVAELASSAKKNTNDIPLIDERNITMQRTLFSIKKLKEKLKGECAVLTADYWNYEWCFRLL